MSQVGGALSLHKKCSSAAEFCAKEAEIAASLGGKKVGKFSIRVENIVFGKVDIITILVLVPV